MKIPFSFWCFIEGICSHTELILVYRLLIDSSNHRGCISAWTLQCNSNSVFSWEGCFILENSWLIVYLTHFWVVPRNVLKRAYRPATRPKISSVVTFNTDF
jgi:hypothetical protein